MENHEANSDAAIGDLVKRLSEQSALLAKQEVELAKAELTQKGKRAGLGAGELGGAAALGLFAFGALTTAIILLIATALDAWLSALIVAVVYGAVAAALGLAGKKQIDEATPPLPERAIESSKDDVETIKTSAKEARS